jgi:flagellar biosynthesis GTPase FlhF
MSINPLIPYIPAFLSFFIYGYLSGFLFLLWKRSRWGCLLTIGFWYLYAVWCIWFGMLVSVQEVTNQTWFVLGVALAFLRPLLQSVAVQNFIEDMRQVGHLGQRAWQAVTRSRTKAASSGTQNQNHQQAHQSQQSQNTYSHGNDQNNQQEQARRAEQARREAEARARRSEKEKENQQSRAEDQKPEPPTADTRTPEEILGLKAGWTQEDLIKTYKSEAQRTHPDKWIGKPAAIRHAMEEEFKNIRQAFDQLKT